ncbi:MAG: polysaccharide deacetylase family protein [Bacteroidetes bacterium]|nr:polysaccharide deacetylase family protein [Bacteroidota bacterium]
MYFVKTPRLVQRFYSNMIWDIPVSENLIFLTFDDGPDPEVTMDVLDMLPQFQAKATFFCVGEKAEHHPEIINRITNEDHKIGNHSYSHLNGRKTAPDKYTADILKAHRVLGTRLFRPPYGKITGKQVSRLQSAFNIIMWSVLPGDFDKSVSKETVLERIIRNTKKGNIIVLHDNIKFKEKMLYALRGTLEHFTKQGYKFVSLEDRYL